ncbi:MAG: DUF1553 domain-containing protein [Verrucomicrobiota bacterium]
MIFRSSLASFFASAFFISTSLSSLAAAPKSESFFESKIAPILEANCLECHNSNVSKGNLSLTSLKETLAGGEDGPGLIPSNPDKSRLVQYISGPDPDMPKKKDALSADQVKLIRQWIAKGADWPMQVVLREKSKGDKSWWAYIPLSDKKPPSPAKLPPEWSLNPIDRYIFAGLAEKKLQPNPPADRHALIRRVTYDLTGLPPTAKEIDTFVNDSGPTAYRQLIERLLDSPAYGERWGRHWLDVIRFGESIGFERNGIIDNAWPFRDYVIKSFNDDKPFDQFTLEHLAGDVIAPNNPAIEVGTTFLVCGPFDNVGNQDLVQKAQIRANTIDEIVRATGEAFLATTIGCARCHDHKFDPVRQEDYYALYATFAGVKHGARVIAPAKDKKARADKLKLLTDNKNKLSKEKSSLENSVMARAEKKASSYDAAYTRPATERYGTEETFAPVKAKHLRFTSEGLDTNPNASSGFRLDEFEVWTSGKKTRNVALASNGGSAEGKSRIAGDFAGAYGAQLTIDGKFGARWVASSPQLTITFAKPETIQRVFFSSDRLKQLVKHSKTTFVGEYRIEISTDGKNWTEVANSHDRKAATAAQRKKRFLKLETQADEGKRLAAISAELRKTETAITALPTLPSWWVGQFAEPPEKSFHVFIGGSPQRPGASVLPASLSTLSEVTPSYQLKNESPEKERRLALAKWIINQDNPLTPRVLANRLWHYHFGTGLVDTPSDFGYMGSKPTHPELLDWLARRIHQTGWRLKDVHRDILLSQTYQQSSAYRSDAAKVDSDSRLLWRFPPRRLSAEEIRDTLLTLSGKLNNKMGGPGFRLYQYLVDNVSTYVPLDHHGPETWRRSVYHQNARAAFVDLLSEFDCPDNAFATPRRSSTTTPLQALTLMNHSFTVEMAGFFAQRLKQKNVAAQVDEAFLLAYGRPPATKEKQAATQLIQQHGLTAFCRALLNSNELIYLN